MESVSPFTMPEKNIRCQAHRGTKESLNELEALLEFQRLLLKYCSFLCFLTLPLLRSSLRLWRFDEKSLPNCHIKEIIRSIFNVANRLVPGALGEEVYKGEESEGIDV